MEKAQPVTPTATRKKPVCDVTRSSRRLSVRPAQNPMEAPRPGEKAQGPSFSSPPNRISRSAESLGRFALTTTFRANGHDCIVSALAEHGPSPKDFLSTVDDFQEHIDDDGWWIHVTQIEPGKIEITPSPDYDLNAANQLQTDSKRDRAAKSPSKPQLHGRVPLKGQISCTLQYYSLDAAPGSILSRPVTVLELPFDDYEIALTVADKLTRKRKRDDAVHTLYHVDQLRRADPSSKSSSASSDLLVLLFSTMPSGEYFLEAIRLFVPLKLLPPDFAAAAVDEIENQRRQRSARKKIKFNGGAMEKVHLFFGKAPPAFRVEHPEVEFDTTLKPEDVESLEFAQLKTELKSRGINASGKKSELVSKLRKHLLTETTTAARQQEGNVAPMQLDFSEAALGAVSSSHNVGPSRLPVPPSPLAPMPSPSAKTIKSALKAKPAVFPEPPGPLDGNDDVILPKRLDFSATTEVAEPKQQVQSQPHQSPARAKRARRSSLALAGLPDVAAPDLSSPTAIVTTEKQTVPKSAKEEAVAPRKSPVKRQPAAVKAPVQEEEKANRNTETTAQVPVPAIAILASPRRSTRRSSLLLPNPPSPV